MPETASARRGDPAIMAARYGAPVSPRTRRTRVLLAAAAAAVVGGSLLALQIANLGEPVAVAENLGFTVEDATTTQVRFNLRTEPGATVRCTIVALNENFTEVGYANVRIGPVVEALTSHRVDLPTTELATTGSVKGCDIVGP